jgi:hypothetical protein
MHYVVQNTIDTKPDSEILFVWLDVNVRCSAAQAIYHQYINQPDDRCVLAGPGQSCKVNFFIVLYHLELGIVLCLKVERFERYVQIAFVEFYLAFGDLGATFAIFAAVFAVAGG